MVHQAERPGTEYYSDLDELLITMRRDREDILDPPDFDSLADLPAARAVAAATFGPGLEWLSHRERNERESPQGAFSWEAVRNAVESTAAERGVRLSEIKATVHILNVEGLWSYVLAPGCTICSSMTAANRDAGGRLLRDVFDLPDP